MAASAAPRFGLVACEVFRREVEALAGRGLGFERAEWLPIALHDRPASMAPAINEAIARLEQPGGLDCVLLAYGLCGGGLAGVQAKSLPLVVPRAHDCISIFLGCARKHEQRVRKQPDTFFLTQGWIEGGRAPGPGRADAIRALYRDREPDEIEDLVDADREAFDKYKRIGFVDTGVSPQVESSCRRCSDFLGWELERIEGTLSWLEALFQGTPWDPVRFLTVPPGHSVQATWDETLLRSHA
ncbi:DUF1638 domain-containing protein [Nibricoccus sp. IMCC34717]|uniref:DUF1638 domain-containing protein n=1 Tax=Nibricoccus sp. IMCC34717 TaxID=3034021 RepID=UPI00384F902E